MTLLEQAKRASTLIDELQSKRSMLEKADKFQKRRDQLTGPASSLVPLINLAHLLREADVPINGLDVMTLAQWQGSLNTMRNEFRERPESILDLARNARQAFLDPLQRFPDQVVAALGSSWTEWVGEHTAAISSDLLQILERIPALRDQVKHIQASLNRLDQLAQNLPQGMGIMALVLATSEDISSRWRSLAGDGLPAEVIAFLRAAGDRNGAGYAMLTAKTRAWLEEHNLLDGLRLHLA